MKRLLILLFACAALFSCSDSGTVSITVTEGTFEAGDYEVFWEPGYESGIALPEGIYMLKFESGDISAELYFAIGNIDSQQGPRFKKVPYMKPIPGGYAISIDKSRYQPGETMQILYTVPEVSQVKISVIWTRLEFSPI